MILKRDQNGMILMLSIVMTTILLAAGIIVATLAIREARLSTEADRGTIAYYGAETALEQASYQILKQGADPLTLDGTTGTFSTNGSWQLSASKQTDQFVFDFIPAGQSVTVNLYNGQNAGASASVSGLALTWTSGSQLAIDVQSWDGQTLTPVGRLTENCTGNPCSATESFTPGLAYNLTVTATGTAITDLIINTNPSGAMVDTGVTVVANSDYQGAKQSLRMKVAEPAPWEGGFSPVIAVCGNGAVEGSEQCDDGNTVSGDGCSSTCQFEAVCGNGTVEGSEQCDDGNTANGDGCSSTCQIETVAVCGNGTVESPEVCDDGDATDAGPCNATCSGFTYCGDGTVQNPNGNSVAEQCDDGNTTDGDGCSSSCQTEVVAVCGNGVVEGSEQCDNGLANSDTTPDACRTNCQLAYCGDNVTDPSNGEDCDGTDVYVSPAGYKSISTGICDTSCHYSVCFDTDYANSTYGLNLSVNGSYTYYDWYVSYISAPVVNQNTLTTYNLMTPLAPFDAKCLSNCSGYSEDSATPYISSNKVYAYYIGHWPYPFVAQPLPSVSYRTGKIRWCAPNVCGNGTREGAEQCDDGNTVSGDGCSSTCLAEGPFCGNGIVETGEQCDDGNFTNYDGCSSTCQLECHEVDYTNQQVGKWFWSSTLYKFFGQQVIPNTWSGTAQYAKMVIPFSTACTGSACSYWVDLGGGQGAGGTGPQTGSGYSYATTVQSFTIGSIANWNRYESSGAPSNAVVYYTQGRVRYCPFPF